MQSIILAAGKGSRLHPITTSRTKAMLPVLGKPMVARVIETIAGSGIRDFILVVSPEDRDITHYFTRESRLEVDIQFAYQPKRLGMADALKQAFPLIYDDFILSACDNLVSASDMEQMISAWRRSSEWGALLSLVEVPSDLTSRSGIVTLEGDRVTRIIEKPEPGMAPSNLASMPLYCFSKQILAYLPKVKLSPRGEYELQDAIQMMIDQNSNVYGIRMQSRLTLTTAADLLAINRHFLESGYGHPQIAPRSVGPGTRLVTPLYIEMGTVIGSNCTIGPNVYIEQNVKIGDGVTLRDAVVLRDATIPEGEELANQVVA